MSEVQDCLRAILAHLLDCRIGSHAVALQHAQCPENQDAHSELHARGGFFSSWPGCSSMIPIRFTGSPFMAAQHWSLLSMGLGRFSEFWAAIVIGGVVAGLIYAVPGVFELYRFR